MGKRRKGVVRYITPPNEHRFEKRPQSVDISVFKGYQPHDYSRLKKRKNHEPGIEANPIPHDIDYIPIAWGWNANFRCGNLTTLSNHTINQVQRYSPQNFIACTSGKHHSLLVNNQGNVYCIGSGQYGQLGIGNPINDYEMPTSILQQATPRQITPSGYIHRGKDLQYQQVACGEQFSLLRQISPQEALPLVQDLQYLERNINNLLGMYEDCNILLDCRSYIRQEICTIIEKSQGKIAVMGYGPKGQLGLGKVYLFSSSPMIIPRLKSICIVKIAAGEQHSLAIDKYGYVYSWGSNTHGKLGHQDYIDRYEPERVLYLSAFHANDCSAGDNHSAIVISSRYSMGGKIIPSSICTFGRGAHGRLGTGSNKSSSVPQLLRLNMPSLQGAEFQKVACGGAHTLALACKTVQPTLSNPRGIVTTVLAWGYGANGQLGDGKVRDSLLPVKVLFTKSVIISQISAGRSWSVATASNGVIFTWGAGFRGQLGLGKGTFAVVPRKVPFSGAVHSISAGYEHNICIASSRRQPVPSYGEDDIFSMKPSLQRSCSLCSVQIGCPRRYPYVKRLLKRYLCKTCKIDRICYDCMKLCHWKHDVHENITDYSLGDRPFFCQCGVREQINVCKLLPVIDEELRFQPHHHKAALRIQTLARRYLARCYVQQRRDTRHRAIFSLCVDYWQTEVMEPVWTKMRAATESHFETNERLLMGIEDDSMHKYVYYMQQQKAIVRMNALMYGVRHMLGASSILIEHPSIKEHIIKERSTFALSHHTLRYQQFSLHHTQRLPPSELYKSTEYIPRYNKREYIYFDHDISLFYRRYVRDIFMIRWLQWKEDTKKKKHDMKVRAAQHIGMEKRKARLLKAKLLKDANALLAGEEVVETVPQSTADIARQLRIEESMQIVQEKERRMQRQRRVEEEADREFEVLTSNALPIHRRHTIADPVGVYARLSRLRHDLSLMAFSKRRFSLVPSIKTLYLDIPTLSRPTTQEGVRTSLELFATRNGQLVEFIDPAYSYVWDRIPAAAKRRRMIYMLTLSWCNPRLPQDTRSMIYDEVQGNRRRSRSISDPERAAQQLQLMFLARNNLARLRQIAYKQENSLIRRRSFDYGECIDADKGLLDYLDYTLEFPLDNSPTVSQLRHTGDQLHKRMKAMWLPGHLDIEEELLQKYLPRGYAMGLSGVSFEMSGQETSHLTSHTIAAQQQQLQEPYTNADAMEDNQKEYWKEYIDEETNLPYYFREKTGESSWVHPSVGSVTNSIGGTNIIILKRYYDEDLGAWYWHDQVHETSIWASIRPDGS